MPPVRQKPEGWYSTQQPQRTSYTARKTSTTETMPKQIPNEIVYAREFLLKRLQPTKRSSQRYFKKDDLDRFGVSVQELDFDTRRLANNRHPPLLKLPPSDIIKTAIYSIEPWKYDGADEPEDLPRRYHQGEVQPTNYYTATYSDDPVEFYHESVMLPGFINCYLLYPRSKTDPDCVQRISRWDQCLYVYFAKKFCPRCRLLTLA